MVLTKTFGKSSSQTINFIQYKYISIDIYDNDISYIQFSYKIIMYNTNWDILFITYCHYAKIKLKNVA